MKKIIFTILVLFLSLVPAFVTAQVMSIEWKKCLGGTNFDNAISVVQATDSNFYVAGYTSSANAPGFGTTHHGGEDFYIVKLDKYGAITWAKFYGGSFDDKANSIIQTSDGNFMIAGSTNSSDGDVSGSGFHPGTGTQPDFWIIKINDAGTILWKKCFGGTETDASLEVYEINNQIFIGGTTNSKDGDVTNNLNYAFGNSTFSDNFWVIKIDAAGAIISQQCKNASVAMLEHLGYYGMCAIDTLGFQEFGWDNPLMVGGPNPDFIGFGGYFGGSGSDEAFSGMFTSTGNGISVGYTSSNDVDVTGNHTVWNPFTMMFDPTPDYWVVKSDTGTPGFLWQKCLGGTGEDYAKTITEVYNNYYLVGGNSNSTDGDLTGSGFHGDFDIWLARLDTASNLNWNHSYGGSSQDYVNKLIRTMDGGFLFVGNTYSTDGDIGAGNNNGGGDMWVTKLSGFVGVNEITTNTNRFSMYPNPCAATSTLVLEISDENNSTINQLTLTDISGKIILNKPIDGAGIDSIKIELNLNGLGLSTGIFLVQLKFNNGYSNYQRLTIR